jgi:sigma-B regulation protein RsbU (phosphoserine phosphatase)
MTNIINGGMPSNFPIPAYLRDITGMEMDLQQAREVQSSLLPATHPPEARVDLGARCAPARMLGGDFYDFFRYSGKSVSAGALGDVSGKGTPAALYAALATGILRSLETQELSPAEMLTVLNQALVKRPVQGKFLSLIYATWDERDRFFRMANSGLPHPIWLHKGEVVEIEVTGLPLGMFEDAEYDEYVLDCAPGDLVAFFTDGVTEAVDGYGEEFGRERLQELVRANRHSSAQDLVDAICDAVSAHAGDREPFDDQTVIAVRT